MDNNSQTDSTGVNLEQSPAKPQQAEVPPKRKLNWKGFFIGIVIVIIIEVFAFNAVKNENKQTVSVISPTHIPTLTKPTPDPTVNWKTFEDQTLHISFKYPPDWQEGGLSAYHGIKPIKDYNPGLIKKTGFPTSIVVMPFDGNIQTFIKDPRAGTNSQSTEQITSKKINNPLYSVTQYVIKTNFSDSQYNGTIYQVTVVENGKEMVAFEDFSESKTLLSQILSTFKFIDTTANWKTFSDNSFSITYPPNWKTTSSVDFTRLKNENKIVMIYDGKISTRNACNSELYPSRFITISSVDTQTSPEEFAIANNTWGDDKLKAEMLKDMNIKNYSVDNISGVIYSEQGECGRGQIIALSNGEKIYLLNTTSIPPNKDSLINQMLSTFKFTK